jgi:hypothetical protein
MTKNNVLDAMLPVIEALDFLEVHYYVGGSVASLTHGIYRATADVDIIADMRLDDVPAFVKILKDDYYVDGDMIKDAIRHRSEFNIIHLATMFKVDIFLPRRRPFDHEVSRRIQRGELKILEESFAFNIESPEDVVLNKLEWYKMSGGSERQWGDVLGVLKVQGDALDFAYMRKWAAEIEVADLLERALQQAGE